MADNIAITPGSGATVATDDVSGVQFQKVKLDLGGDGASTPVSGSVPINDNSGALTVDNAGTFAVQDSEKIADNAGFTDGTSKVQPVGYIFDESAGTALTENDAAAARIDSKRAQVSVIEDETTRGRRATVTAGNALKVDASSVAVPVTDNSGSLTVDNNGTFAVQDSEKVADNAGFTDGTTKVVPVGYIFDEVAGTALTENDIGAARMDSKRAGIMSLEDATTRGQRAAVSAAGRLSVDASGVAVPITDNSGSITVDNATASSLKTEPAGNIAHDSADSGNPIKMGAKAETDLAGSTMVTDGDRTDLYADLDGVLITKPMVPFNNIITERLSNTDGASTASTAFGATSSARNMITSIVVYNDSTTNGFIDFRDGTAGSVIFTLPLPAKGGVVFNPPIPLRQPTVNTALAFDVSAALTTVYISLIGFKSKA